MTRDNEHPSCFYEVIVLYTCPQCGETIEVDQDSRYIEDFVVDQCEVCNYQGKFYL